MREAVGVSTGKLMVKIINLNFQSLFAQVMELLLSTLIIKTAPVRPGSGGWGRGGGAWAGGGRVLGNKRNAGGNN